MASAIPITANGPFTLVFSMANVNPGVAVTLLQVTPS